MEPKHLPLYGFGTPCVTLLSDSLNSSSNTSLDVPAASSMNLAPGSSKAEKGLDSRFAAGVSSALTHTPIPK